MQQVDCNYHDDDTCCLPWYSAASGNVFRGWPYRNPLDNTLPRHGLIKLTGKVSLCGQCRNLGFHIKIWGANLALVLCKRVTPIYYSFVTHITDCIHSTFIKSSYRQQNCYNRDVHTELSVQKYLLFVVTTADNLILRKHSTARIVSFYRPVWENNPYKLVIYPGRCTQCLWFLLKLIEKT